MEKESEMARTMVYFNYYAWPENSAPTSPVDFFQFLRDVNYNRDIYLAEANKDGWLLQKQSLVNQPVLKFV